MFKDHLATIISRTDLTESQMADMMSAIFDGRTTDAQVGAMMAALATKGETFEELAGAARAMRTKAHRIQVAKNLRPTTPVVRVNWSRGGADIVLLLRELFAGRKAGRA